MNMHLLGVVKPLLESWIEELDEMLAFHSVDVRVAGFPIIRFILFSIVRLLEIHKDIQTNGRNVICM